MTNLRNMATVYVSNGDEMLLLFRQGGRVVTDVWVGTAGGHMEESEINNPQTCVLREMGEEMGLTQDDVENLHLKYVTLRHVKGEIRQNYYYFCTLKGEKRAFASNEGVLQWHKKDALLQLPMPVTAKQMLTHYLHTGCGDDKLYVGVTAADGMHFTDF